ncbi:molybdopterin-dependent oxidoreductase [Streptomyces boninensis]|uniref:molybdopterin-dependent oxidoreductase n=1 Tax=Streptomyces boninensis TaxID=2039455 RepID=UPI003B227AA2
MNALLRTAAAALDGLLAAGAALGVAELTAAAVRRESSPIVAVGSAVIDVTPAGVKDWAIRQFGSNDKLVLQLGVLLVLALFAIALGIAALRVRRSAAAGVLAFGVIGALAATSRPDGSATDAVPSIAGALVGAGVLYGLTGALRTATDGSQDERTGVGRRRFLLGAAAVAAGSAAAGVIGRVLNTASGDAAASRAAVRLPAPVSKAAPVPKGTDLKIEGLSRFTTAAKDFYRVDTALVVPQVDARDWSLRLHGDGVKTPIEIDFDQLLARGLIERDITLNCVSSEVGGPYIGNARWLGVPLAELLRDAGVRPPSRGGPADQLVARSTDGMTIGTPVETVMDGRDAMLAVAMNGEPLTFVHGFPVRMLVPGLYGYVSACKWLTELELTTFDAYDTYWTKRDWSARAPVKTQSRIDTPKPFAKLKPGRIAVAGVAWAQHRGIDQVEVRLDDGPWQKARLAAEDSRDTWRQWVWEWDATPGSHTLTVRATDRTGATQTARRAPTRPDGATGRHSVVVNVT